MWNKINPQDKNIRKKRSFDCWRACIRYKQPLNEKSLVSGWDKDCMGVSWVCRQPELYLLNFINQLKSFVSQTWAAFPHKHTRFLLLCDSVAYCVHPSSKSLTIYLYEVPSVCLKKQRSSWIFRGKVCGNVQNHCPWLCHSSCYESVQVSYLRLFDHMWAIQKKLPSLKLITITVTTAGCKPATWDGIHLFCLHSPCCLVVSFVWAPEAKLGHTECF